MCVCVCVCLCQLCNITTTFSKTCINPVGQWKRGGSGVEGGGVLFLLQGWLHATPFCLIMHVDYATGCFLQQVIDSVGLESQQ